MQDEYLIRVRFMVELAERDVHAIGETITVLGNAVEFPVIGKEAR